MDAILKKFLSGKCDFGSGLGLGIGLGLELGLVLGLSYFQLFLCRFGVGQRLCRWNSILRNSVLWNSD